MRISRLFGQTLREAPGEARTPGYGFLLRAGFVRAIAPGGVALLPLGVQVRRRIEERTCGALTALGGQPVALPDARPADIQEPTHAAALVAASIGVVQSYRQLPSLLYEVRQASDDGERAVGGLLGAREGRVVDAFSLHADAADLAQGYERLRAAVSGLLSGCAITAIDCARRASSARCSSRAWPNSSPIGASTAL